MNKSSNIYSVTVPVSERNYGLFSLPREPGPSKPSNVKTLFTKLSIRIYQMACWWPTDRYRHANSETQWNSQRVLLFAIQLTRYRRATRTKRSDQAREGSTRCFFSSLYSSLSLSLSLGAMIQRRLVTQVDGKILYDPGTIIPSSSSIIYRPFPGLL